MLPYGYTQFEKQAKRLIRTGGHTHTAYREAAAAINNWRHSVPVTLTHTNSGGNRIPHTVKYDLHGAYRLVPVEYEPARIRVFVGSHAESEHWLNSNRHATFVVNRHGQIELFRIDASPRPSSDAARRATR